MILVIRESDLKAEIIFPGLLENVSYLKKMFIYKYLYSYQLSRIFNCLDRKFS